MIKIFLKKGEKIIVKNSIICEAFLEAILKAILETFPEPFVKGFPEPFLYRHFFTYSLEHSLRHCLNYFTWYFERFSLKHTQWHVHFAETFLVGIPKRVSEAFPARYFSTHSPEHSLRRYLKYFTRYSTRLFLKCTPKHSPFSASLISVQGFKNSFDTVHEKEYDYLFRKSILLYFVFIEVWKVFIALNSVISKRNSTVFYAREL